jgi:hypothetical protein
MAAERGGCAERYSGGAANHGREGGVYFYELRAGEFRDVRRMSILK